MFGLLEGDVWQRLVILVGVKRFVLDGQIRFLHLLINNYHIKIKINNKNLKNWYMNSLFLE